MLNNHQKPLHTPVLAGEVLMYLNPKAGETYLDLTAGFGGHASLVLERTGFAEGSTLVDRDDQAIEALNELFGKTKVRILHSDYLSASRDLNKKGEDYDLILADIGVSSLQLDEPDRGFAFSLAGPLDMRMDRSQEINAASIVNEWDETELGNIIRTYGEEPKASAIAKAIVANRPITSTDGLADIVTKAVGKSFKRRRQHPATKTFQAIRLVVNDELKQLEQSLPIWMDLLNPGGRMAIISFHSLEDRIVKKFFAEHGGNYFGAELNILNKKPITATLDEIVSNPRSRSAKLRVAEKLKQK
jgi:16S rRNA (cytosine1402-N4)-methyltransferase